MPLARSVRNRILLAEDDAELRATLVAVLDRAGFAVDGVSSGIGLVSRIADALLYGNKAPADAIVTDVRMPGCNGLSVAEGLRANGWTTPIVVISAFGDDDMRGRVARMSRAWLLEKPFDALVLQTILTDALDEGDRAG
jgi:DNA-binding response OmpR family regulator